MWDMLIIYDEKQQPFFLNEDAHLGLDFASSWVLWCKGESLQSIKFHPVVSKQGVS